MVLRSSLGGRRPWWRSAAPGEAIFVGRLLRGFPPLGRKSQKFGLGRISKDLERKLSISDNILYFLFLVQCRPTPVYRTLCKQ